MTTKAPFIRDASGQVVVNTAAPYWNYWLMPDEALAEGLHHSMWLFFTKTPQNITEILQRTCELAGVEMALGNPGDFVDPAIWGGLAQIKPLKLPQPVFWLGSDKSDSVTQLPKGSGEAVRVYVEPIDKYVTSNMLFTILANLSDAFTTLRVERTSVAITTKGALDEAALDAIDYTTTIRPLRPVKYSEYLSSNAYYMASATWERNAPTTTEIEAKLAGIGLEFVPVPGASTPTGSPSVAFVLGTNQYSPQVDAVRAKLGAQSLYIDRLAMSSSQAAVLKLQHETEPIRQRIHDIGFGLAEGTLGLAEAAAGIPGSLGGIGMFGKETLRTVGYIALGGIGAYILYRVYQATWAKR